MKIENMADVYQGITIARIKNNIGETEKYPVYSYSENEENQIDIPKEENLRSEIPFTKRNMVLLSLTSHRASIIEANKEGMVIPSAFIVMELKEGVDPHYLEWYLNNDRDFFKSLQIIKQGSAILTIPIQSFREINIQLPNLEAQKKMGNINRLMKRSQELSNEKQELLNQKLRYINQEGKKDDK